MLSRSDSATSTSLHRSKSNASVRDRKKHPLPPEPIDPEQARVHALIAAHRAMDRSQSRSSGDIGRADSNASRRTAPARPGYGHVQFSPATQLRHQRSALQSRLHPPSTGLRAPPQTQLDTQYIEFGPEEFGHLAGRYGEEPSSYRKVRRTRSMLTPRRRMLGNTISPKHTPFSQAPTLRNSTSNMGIAESGLRLRLKRSLNALRPTSRLSMSRRPDTHIGYHDDAAKMAREQYLTEMQDGSVRARSSAIVNPKVRREQKAFRKTVRTGGAADTISLVPSDSYPTDTMRSDSSKRSFSATLKDRVKRVLGMPLSKKPIIPLQQPDASHIHFGHEQVEDVGNNSFDDYHVDELDDRRQSFYVSAGEYDPDEELNRFSPDFQDAASRESLHSNSRSRVTSWTNSTITADSGSARGTALERNRLSIIKEDGGPHQPSSSAGRHFGGINAQHDQPPDEDEVLQVSPVDSQRIYSALMKRIGEEEDEMEQTRAAPYDIHNGYSRATNLPYSKAHATIRAVSTTTVGTAHGDEGDPHMRQENISPDDYTSGMTPKMHKHNVDRRKAKLASLQEQSSFFPFSGEEQSTTPSPFRKLLQERRSQGRSDDSMTEGFSTQAAIVANEDRAELGKGRFGMSSESIYSRNTDGGMNPNYVRPGRSTDRGCSSQDNIGETGMATIIRTRSKRSSDSRPKLDSAGSSEKREWSGWMKDQMTNLSRSDATTSHHIRERAHIDPDDTRVGGNDTGRPPSRHGKNRFPLLDLKEVPRNQYPAPRRSSSFTKSQTGLLKRVSSLGLISNTGKKDESQTEGGIARKASPGNIARILKERKSQLLATRNGDKDKENSPTPAGDSPPVSTPGRLTLQMRSGNGKLRKTTSKMALAKDQMSAKGFGTPNQPKTKEYDESPTDRIKPSLSARLSRPFNMDVPPENRPFDSMYLGKREGGVPGNRLSTAVGSQRGPKGYGGLGPSPFAADTALPEVPESDVASEKMKGLWSSKRMVSDFLKRRRGGKSTSEATEEEKDVEEQWKEKEMTPAFL